MNPSQYEVFDNPIPRARRAFPLVAILQFDLADTGSDRLVAPLVPRAHLAAAAGRLMPIVTVLGAEHVLIVPRMTPVAAADLGIAKGRLTDYRNDIAAALDLLFLGV